MKLASLRDLFVDELKDLYSAENQLVKALPKIAAAVSDPDLKAGIEEHLEETKGHIERLETIFKGLDASPKGKKCAAMEGLLEEGSELLKEDAAPAVKDAAIIAACQKVEHYEIASYGTVRTWAQMLGEEEAMSLLNETLDEEAACDEKLSDLAESCINADAAAGRAAVERM